MKIKIKTYDFIKPNEGMLVYNGVERIVRFDGTNKEARYTVKKPRAVRFATHYKKRIMPKWVDDIRPEGRF